MKIPLNLPNILSLYRLISLPFVLVFIYLGWETVFVSIFVFNQITDIADGYIARKYNLSTPIGALLDSYADIGSYIMAAYGIYAFQPIVFEYPYKIWWLTFLSIYFIQYLVTYFRYGRWAAGLHLYSSKITGYVQGIFLVILFIYGLVPSLFYFALSLGIFAELENVIINLLSPKPILNAKGLWWILKDGRLKNQDVN